MRKSGKYAVLQRMDIRKMFCLFSKVSTEKLQPIRRSAQFFSDRLEKLDISLLIETFLVTIAAILAIMAFSKNFFPGDAWFVAPGILVGAAIIPTVIKKRKFSGIGFSVSRIRHSLVVLGWTCVVVFPSLFAGLWLLGYYGLSLPLRPILPEGQSLACWILYQFLYVAVAEEVFFRGYVQGNVLRLLSVTGLSHFGLQQWISITLSAAFFAAAHIIVGGQIISILTFVPGLILGWLFVRTGSLLAPILFHGLANICYFLIAAAIV